MILLLESIHKERSIALTKEKNRPRTAGLPFASSRDPLLDDAATKVGVDPPIIRTFRHMPEIVVGKTSAPGNRANCFV